MPQTEPFTYIVPRKLTDAELARALRLDAAAELDAMNLYQAHIEATDNDDARNFWRSSPKTRRSTTLCSSRWSGGSIRSKPKSSLPPDRNSTLSWLAR